MGSFWIWVLRHLRFSEIFVTTVSQNQPMIDINTQKDINSKAEIEDAPFLLYQCLYVFLWCWNIYHFQWKFLICLVLLYPEIVIVKLTYGLYVSEGSTTFRQFRSIKVLCLAKSDPSTMLYITVHNSYLHLWSTGQLFGFPSKLWGIRVQTSYWKARLHQNWVCSRPTKKLCVKNWNFLLFGL